MPHDLLGERFFNKSRTLAWHKLGIHEDREMTAVEVLQMLGEPVVTKEPLFAKVNGSVLEMPEHVIIRHPVDEDPEYVPFGIVGEDYRLITAGDLAQTADKHVGKPVETMGFLARGSIFFATFALPAIDVKGDPLEMYLGTVAPMNGRRAASVEKWATRVVCRNTFEAATAASTEKYAVFHDVTALDRLGEWMREMYDRSQKEVRDVKKAFEMLADRRATKKDAQRVIFAAYPMPPQPSQNAPTDVLKDREIRWDKLRGYVVRRRESAEQLFDGRGTGIDSRATKGTLYGAVQSVIELENNRRGQTEQSVAESNIVGQRALAKRRALDEAFAIASK